MDGGPSHKDTFDLKPGTARAPASSSRSRPASPASRSASTCPKVAQLMNHAAIVRGMTTAEGRPRAGPSTTCTPATAKGRAASSTRRIGSIVSPRNSASRRVPAAELRRHRQPQLRLRLPRAEAPAADRQRPDPRRREPEAGRRRPGSSTTASACSRRWRTAFHRDYQADADQRPPDDLPAGRHADAVEGGEGVRPVAGAGASREAATAAAGSARLPAGPPAGRGRRAVRRGEPRRLGHAPGQLRPRQEPVRAGRSGPIAPLVTDLKDRGLLDTRWSSGWASSAARRTSTPAAPSRAATTTRGPGAWRMFGGGIKGGQVIGKTDKEGASVAERPDHRPGLPGHRLRAAGHRLHQAERDAERPADPHRRQGQAVHGHDCLISVGKKRLPCGSDPLRIAIHGGRRS